MTLPADIAAYHERLDPTDRAIGDALAAAIGDALPEATAKVWHAHPVWFLDDNPIVGYDRLKDAVRLFFWSGQSFTTPGLTASGTFKAAEARYTDVSQLDLEQIAHWLAEAREIQWDYANIRRDRGNLHKRTEF